MGAVQANVSLALLHGVIERMGVQERPYELPADILETELKMGVLKDGVMAAVIRCSANVDALLLGDFFGADYPRGIAGARGGDRGVERMGEGVAQGNAGRARVNQSG